MTRADRQQVHEQLESELTVLWRRVRRLSIALARQVDAGIDVAAYGLLSALNDAGDVRAGDLADRFGLDKSTVSRQIAQMESLGFIERVPDPLDGRARLIRTTEVGRARVRQLRGARGEWFGSALQHWDAADVDQLVELLGRLNEALESRDP
ncbi:MarR family winged helix-turn-helix transcriptional regulator [Haloactinopolyspora sp.]|uniref:MarR family winged helix-turn-helix transcriptional regulator n=1 Tax=Haloactinopolyspora sp. TaxID=1966353 RepID=UPI00263723BF|nr:MarR family winged helix-turn-helix transcriptional regulator [Haloactinopolyspora sp.]